MTGIPALQAQQGSAAFRTIHKNQPHGFEAERTA